MKSKCILSKYSLNKMGYARKTERLFGKLERYHHRIEFIKATGKLIPKGMVLDHLCRVPNCINVEHLEIVTHKENFLRGINPKFITHQTGICKNGHDMKKVGVYRYPNNKRKGVLCNQCKKDYILRFEQRPCICGGASKIIGEYPSCYIECQKCGRKSKKFTYRQQAWRGWAKITPFRSKPPEANQE